MDSTGQVIIVNKPPPPVRISSNVPGHEQRERQIKEAKRQYKTKLKRHKNSVLALYAERGLNDVQLISGDAD